MTRPVPIAIVGLGKIARDQHLPALATGANFRLAATVSHHGTAPGVPSFATLAEAFAAHPEIEAVSLCTPPQVRHALAREALLAGRHVFLEKPPGATLSEVEDLKVLAAARDLTLFASWHSRFADAVEPARAFLAGRRLKSAEIVWKEDVRHWHPGQDWIFQPGGMGVFDPGINALSIITAILPQPIHLRRASLAFPANRAAPIAADLIFEDVSGAPVTATFDFLQTGSQSWDIHIEAEGGRLELSGGGSALSLNGQPQALEHGSEYGRLYDHFAGLVRRGEREVDCWPLIHVADAFMLGERREVPAFDW
ncbi:Gfo/Idh/MocA family protein [Phenylobacterium montanum]|uniref:Gfo/Idh/MocA family oxidoreductase n=1 Tax=Phenylobacterium montanum TaxID=2823693 RepID=A0A975FY85_9CAUL|nr:Gfo/Idh/MocA family oxidoreductase [Caulobacter sp. S6]QUD86486.1 Gfo/Idh/MocA family oxidoreductase [Caulobacter sp. S6]